MGLKLFKTFSTLILCSFVFISCENMPCDGENCAEEEAFMMERNDLLDDLHVALESYELDATVDVVFEHCNNDDLRSIAELVACNESPDALDCNDVEPVEATCEKVVGAFIPMARLEVPESTKCWTVGTWFPGNSCAPAQDRGVCSRGWGVYTSEARCCMAGQGAFEDGCSITHDVLMPTAQVDTLPLANEKARLTSEPSSLICGADTTEVDGICMSDVRCGADTIYRDGLCISNVTTCSGPDVFQTPGGECRSAVRAFTEEHCGEGTALIHGICRSIVTECEGPEVGIHNGECLSRIPKMKCGAGTLLANGTCEINPLIPTKCADGTVQKGNGCVAIPGAITAENCGHGTKLVDGKYCAAIPQKPVIVTELVQSSDQCVVARTRDHMAVTLRGNGIDKTARYSCDAGYELVGDKVLTCDKAADAKGNVVLRWRGQAPQCHLITPKCEVLAAGAVPSCFPNCDYEGFNAAAAVWSAGWTKTMEAGYLGADCGGNVECNQGRAYAGYACNQ